MAIHEEELQELLSKEATLTSNASELADYPLQLSDKTDTSVHIEEPTKELNSLDKIVETRTELSKVKESLVAVIDNMQKNRSIISQTAEAYNELALWQKIGIGVVVAGPTVAIGLVAHIWPLLIIGGVTGVTYTAGGILLDDHHTCNINIAEQLKKGVMSLANVLELIINALDKIRQELANEIDKFREENCTLKSNIVDLGDEINRLTSQVAMCVATVDLLNLTKYELEETAKRLKESVENHGDLLQKTQQELEKVKVDYEKSQIELSKKVAELNSFREKMSVELQKAQSISLTLTGAMETLAGTVIEDEKQRQLCQERLEAFLNQEDASLVQVTGKLSKTEEELARTKEELRRINGEYKALIAQQKTLLEQQAEQVMCLVAQLDLKKENILPDGNQEVIRGNNQHRLFAIKSLNLAESTPVHQTAIPASVGA